MVFQRGESCFKLEELLAEGSVSHNRLRRDIFTRPGVCRQQRNAMELLTAVAWQGGRADLVARLLRDAVENVAQRVIRVGADLLCAVGLVVVEHGIGAARSYKVEVFGACCSDNGEARPNET